MVVDMVRVDYGQMHPVGVVRGVAGPAGVDRHRHGISGPPVRLGLEGPENGGLDLVLDCLGVGELVPALLDFPPDVGFVGEAEGVPAGVVVDVEGVVLDGPDCFSDDVFIIVFRGHHALDHLGARQSAVGAGGQAAQQDDLGRLFRQGVPELLDRAGVPGDVRVDAGVEGLVMDPVYQFVADPAVFGG